MDMTAHLPEPDSELAETARLWVIRMRDRAFDDWDGLTEWLEAAPAHLEAYEAALAQEEWLDDALGEKGDSSPAFILATQPAPLVAAAPDGPGSAPANDVAAASGYWRAMRRWPVFGGAVAAALAAVAGWVVLQGSPHEIVTARGEHRTVALADGSRITLNGGTRISFDPDKPRIITLAQGEALFDVRHDASDPFVVMAGDARLLDVGTVFNVVSDNGAVDVAVAEGEVIYEPEHEAIRLSAGDALVRAARDARPVLRKAQASAVGAWRAGRLEYDDASLARIARDLGRNLGRTVRAAPGTERLRFSGTLVVDGAERDVLARAGPLLGVSFAPDGDGWRMTPANVAP